MSNGGWIFYFIPPKQDPDEPSLLRRHHDSFMSHFIDIIIPVRNEEENVAPLVDRLHTAFHSQKISYSLIFIDDRSTDNTVKILQKLSKKYPLSVYSKIGRGGKAFSILEGVKHTTSTFVGMIDADLQYPPEVIPEMLRLTETFGVVVARRDSTKDSKFRRFISKGFQYVFGKLLFNLDCDVQSGLKVFHRDIIEQVREEDVSAWTLDVPLLTTALEMGESIGEVSITFDERKHGQSKIKLVQSITEIGGQAIVHKFKTKRPILIKTDNPEQMVGAGLYHKGKKFITHTTLDHNISALTTISRKQKLILFSILTIAVLGIMLNFVQTLKIIVGILSFIYFVDVIFNFILILKSLKSPPEINFTPTQLRSLQKKDLPMYSVLCPLYKEAHILPAFVESISKMEWPKEKLDVMLLLEEDDEETIASARNMNLPAYVRIVVVPNSQPKTKPKACNYGLHMAKGEYIVIYDAEDIPDPLQLKKAYLAFTTGDQSVRCYQAKLNYHNPHQNLLTRFFTAEYSLWFDVILTGLQTIQTTIPLGGTSNHFRKKDLLALQGWDPFNVTEDCDLGVRLFKNGWKTAIIDSVTLEEANSNWHNWLRQRSRWIKGYMQTYLIHMRHPLDFIRRKGIHALLFQLTIGGKIAFMIINPIMWLLTISYFTLYQFVGPTIEEFYPSIVFYMAVTSLIFGNFMFIYYYMIGAAKREHWTLVKWVYLVPFYWLMVSIAAVIALYQLIVKPHYWEKTVHGLHLKKEKLEKEAEKTSKFFLASFISQIFTSSKPAVAPIAMSVSPKRLNYFKKISAIVNLRKNWMHLLSDVIHGKYRAGALLVLATMGANILNMLTNFYMGHELNLQDFAVFNTYLSILNIITLFSSALSTTVNQKTANLLGKTNAPSAVNFWLYLKNRMLFVSIILTGLWIIALPWSSSFVSFHSVIPLLLFSPVIMTIGVNAISQGYLRGALAFDTVAIAVITQPLVRLLATVLIGESHLDPYAYVSIPLGVISATLVSFFYARRGSSIEVAHKEFRLPKTFFSLALVSNLSAIAFFSLDNIFVAHYLSPQDTGLYGIMGLLGKMVFFSGSLISGFILPITAFREGKGISSEQIFYKLLLLTAFFSTGAFLILGVGVPFLAPLYFGVKINAVRHLIPLYSFGILLYTIAQSIVQFHLAKKQYVFAISAFLIATIQVAGLFFFHSSLNEITAVMSLSGAVNLVILLVLHIFYKKIHAPLQNIVDLFDLFVGKISSKIPTLERKDSYRILIFNWRDTRHKWAGGAEVYIHEMAKELISQGHRVTIFCGNDGESPRNQVIDGVQVVRRGGFYTVYVWAFLYYVLRFRKFVDVIIDSENGIPFLTPLYVKKPIFLLIHHVHQEVFRTQLKFPWSEIASIIEGDVMTYLYRNHEVVTVSNSSKKEIIDLGLGTKESIQVIHPGIQSNLFKKTSKTRYPSLLYVGRLKPYKNVDIALQSFAGVLKKYPKATCTIAGNGECLNRLRKLSEQLQIEKSTTFIPQITDKEKAKLYARHWVAIQPSSIEGWGITVIEANASGTPVIASNVKGLKDSVQDGETGILVKAKDPEAFAEAIIDLFTHTKKRRMMSQKALNWATQFTWKNSTKKLLQFMTQHMKEEERIAFIHSENVLS